jgi:hypothetical protein
MFPRATKLHALLINMLGRWSSNSTSFSLVLGILTAEEELRRAPA